MSRLSREHENLFWRGEVTKQIRIPKLGANSSSGSSQASYPEPTAAGGGRGKKTEVEEGGGTEGSKLEIRARREGGDGGSAPGAGS